MRRDPSATKLHVSCGPKVARVFSGGLFLRRPTGRPVWAVVARLERLRGDDRHSSVMEVAVGRWYVASQTV